MFRLTFIIFTILLANTVNGQKINEYNLKIIENHKYYKQLVENDSTQKLIELKSIIPDLIYDLRYASKNNFTEKKMYPANTHVTYLRMPAANALKIAAEELRKLGYGIKIFDAYRPYSVTEKFWKLIGDERYVAHPGSGSGHNRGLSVDLTLIDLKTGEEIEMGTGYDEFKEIAHFGSPDITAAATANREILKNIMIKNGFRLLQTEWWHYSWPNTNKNYDVMNIAFRKLR